jgi:hypothetical protein
MKTFIVITGVLLLSFVAKAQQYVYHTDLFPQVIENSSFKMGSNELYANKLSSVKSDRTTTSAYAAIIEEAQNLIFSSLTNVDDGIKNGKTVYYVVQKIPMILDNLETATSLAIDKPYLATIAAQSAQVFAARLTNLSSYLQNFILSSNESTLINQADRDKFVHKLYEEVNILYSLSQSLVNDFTLYNLQDAINKIIPYKQYINMDEAIATGIVTRFKF